MADMANVSSAVRIKSFFFMLPFLFLLFCAAFLAATPLSRRRAAWRVTIARRAGQISSAPRFALHVFHDFYRRLTRGRESFHIFPSFFRFRLQSAPSPRAAHCLGSSPRGDPFCMPAYWHLAPLRSRNMSYRFQKLFFGSGSRVSRNSSGTAPLFTDSMSAVVRVRSIRSQPVSK